MRSSTACCIAYLLVRGGVFVRGPRHACRRIARRNDARSRDRKRAPWRLSRALAVAIYPLIYSRQLSCWASARSPARWRPARSGFVLLLGYAHQLAFGQAGFLMVGGYASAILCVNYGWDPFAALLVGIVLSMALAYAIGAADPEVARLRPRHGVAGDATRS